MTFQVSGQPFSPVMIYVSPVPCVPGTFTGTSCQGTVLDLAVFPPPFNLTFGFTNAVGTFTYVLPMPPVSPPITVATQSMLLCVPSFLTLFTQAYDVTLT